MVRKYLKDKYLSGAGVKENYIFYLVSEKVMDFAKDSLLKNPNGATVCICSVNKENCIELDKILNKCANIFQKSLISDIYFSTVLLQTIISKNLLNKTSKSTFISNSEENIEILKKADLESLVKNIDNFPRFLDIKNLIQKEDLFELNIFLDDVENKFLQNGINNFLNNENKFAVKIFTDSESLASYKMTNSLELIHKFHYFNGPILDSGIDMSKGGFIK